MANGFYTPFKTALGVEKHHLTVDGIYAYLVDAADYSVNLASHAFLSDIAVGARVASFGPLTSPTWVNAVFDTADFAFPTVVGDQAEGIALVNYTGDGAAADAARMLIMWFDTGITGMPVTPNGANINVTVNSSGWFSL